jgi:cell wall-associated NlpC family hydrolase
MYAIRHFLFISILLTQSFSLDGSLIAKNADSYIGLKYVWGGTNLDKGVDCSAFVKGIYKKYGYIIPRTAKNQALYKKVKTITHISQCKIGDAIYFKDKQDHIHHVAIITGYANDGRPIITHAKGKKFGIVKERMNNKYLSEFIGAKRFYIATNQKKYIYLKPVLLKGGGLFYMN